MWWIGSSHSRPCLSVAVFGLDGDAPLGAKELAAALSSLPGGRLARELTVHVANSPSQLADVGSMSVDLVVCVAAKGGARSVEALVRGLPPDLRCGRTLVVAEPDSADPHGFDGVAVPVLRDRWRTPDGLQRLASRIAHSFARTLGLANGIPAVHRFDAPQ